MKTVTCTALLLMLAFLSGCGSKSGGSNSSTSNTSGGSTPTVTSIQVSPGSMAIGVGANQQFKAMGHLSDGTSQDMTGTVQWGSSDSSIASISATGIATGSAAGSVTITAQSGSMQSTATLTVSAAAANLTSISISPAASSIPVNTSQQFTATGNYSDGSSADLTNLVTWSSSSTSVATITAGGLASAAAAGSTNISASFSGVSQSTTLTVTAPTVVSIAVTPVGLTLGIGINQQFVATATYSDGSSSDLSSGVTWTSSSTSVATVSSSGLVTTVAAGQTTIMATFGSFSDTSLLTVVAAHLTSIEVSPTTPSIAAGTQQEFTAVGTFDDGSTQLLTSLTWSATPSSVARIDANGLASGVGSGTATITATSGSVSGMASMTVTAATLVSISVTPANPGMAVGTTKQFAATGTFSDSSTQDVTTSVLWTSSSSAVATINAQGLATSVANGSTTITGTFGSVSGQTTLTVSTAHLVSIAVNPANPRIEKGTSIKFTATGTFSDGSAAANLAGIAWKSSKPNLASIRSTGIAHGKKGGIVTISASSSGVTGSTSLTVGTGTLASLVVTPATPTCTAGTTQQFAATGTFSDGSAQDLTLNSHWSSSSAPVATIANAPSVAGLANCNAAGASTIGANSGGTTGSAALTVQ
jgi:uncharacterized protein YjdB